MRLPGGLLHRFSRLRISAKVSAASIAMVIFQGILTIAWVSILITQTNRESFRAQLDRTTHSVESFIDSARTDLAIKANLLAGQQKIIDYTDYGLPNLLQQELSVQRLPLKVDALCIVDANRVPVTAVGEQRLIQAFMNKSLASNWWEGNPLFIVPAGNQIHLWALSPIIRAKTVIGVLAIGLNLDSNFINRIEWINNTAVLLSWQGQIFVSGTLPDTFFHRFVGIVRTMGATGSDARSATGRYFISTSRIQNLPGLYVYCFVDTGEASKLLARYRALSLGFLVVVIAAGLFFSLLLYRYVFLTPFQLLNDAIRGIAAGDLLSPIGTVGHDEFGDLARAFEDMTRSLRQREKELAELGSYNALVLSNVSSGIITVGFDHVITAINPAACSILGLAPAEAGRALEDLAVPPELLQVINDSLQPEPSTSIREVRAEIDGSIRTLAVSTSPLLSPLNARLGVIVILSDVTHEKELEKKLELSSRMAAMGEMVAGVAHQIRNPLAIMKVSAELLRDHIAATDAGKQPHRLASMIVNEADSLGSVVSNFLDFARPHALRREPCSIETILRAVISQLPLGSFPGVSMNCDFPGDLPAAPLDRSLLEQAFRNLLMNALEVSSAGQDVRVSAWRDDGWLGVEIRDSGPGMDEATQKRIFSPFFTTKSSGTGLGLSIVHRIIDSHGGKIELRSAPGAGTAFRIFLEAGRS